MPKLLLNRREALASLSLLASACAGTRDTPAPGAEAEAGALLDAVADRLLKSFPEAATTLGLDKGDYADLRSRLRDRSAAGQQKLAAQLREDLNRVEALDVSSLSLATRISVEVVKSAFGTALEGFALPFGYVSVGSWLNSPYVVIQNVGAYLVVPRFLDARHPIDTAEDAQAYLARVESYASQLDGELGRIRAAREDASLTPPAFLLDKALHQLKLSAARAREGGALVESIERRTKAKGIAGNWAEQAAAIASQKVAPALERQIAELKIEREVATDDPGMWAKPHGDGYYRWALAAATTTTLSPDEVHAQGLDELKTLHGRMDPILRSLGYTRGSIGDRMKALAKDPRYRFAPGDEGRAEIMAFIQERLRIIRAELPKAFHTLMAGRLEVTRLPPEEEPGAPGAFGGPGSIDGTIPGRFWINLLTTDLHSRYSLPSLTHHEAIPGHVWQGEYANTLPTIRTLLSFSAFSEGWALYAEQLADELGVYDDFPVGRLGYLQSIAFRACRLVVDTGLHAKRWTREQAVSYFVDVNGSNPKEVATEVDRYCSWPGQACGYKIGHSEINRLRSRVQEALGPKYDLKAFDDAVVLGGNVPLDVLAKIVGEHIERAKSS